MSGKRKARDFFCYYWLGMYIVTSNSHIAALRYSLDRHAIESANAL